MNSLRLFLFAPANNSLEATWDAPRFAIDGDNLLIWRARVVEIPGASPLGFASGCFAKLEAVRGHFQTGFYL
jgi:hypothetical protein